MASFLTDEENKKQGGAFSTATGAKSGGGASTGGPSSAGGDMKKRGSGFVNVGQYLAANQGDISRMAGDVGSKLESGYKSDVSGLKSSGSEQIGGIKKADVAGADYFKDPSKISQEDFNKYYNQGENTGAYEAKDTDRFKTFLGDVGSFDSRKKILKDQYGRPSYTGGQQSLDSLLLGAKAGDLTKKAEGFEKGYSAEQTAQRNAYEKARKEANQGISDARTSFRNLFEQERTDASKSLEDLYGQNKYGADYVKAGQAASDRAEALNSLIGANVRDVDWQALSDEREKAVVDALNKAGQREIAKVPAPGAVDLGPTYSQNEQQKLGEYLDYVKKRDADKLARMKKEQPTGYSTGLYGGLGV